MKLGSDHRVPLAHCNYCNERVDGATQIDGDGPPKEGDVMICVYCSGLNIYTADGRLRRPTPEEVKKTSTDRKLMALRTTIFMQALARRRHTP